MKLVKAYPEPIFLAYYAVQGRTAERIFAAEATLLFEIDRLHTTPVSVTGTQHLTQASEIGK